MAPKRANRRPPGRYRTRGSEPPADAAQYPDALPYHTPRARTGGAPPLRPIREQPAPIGFAPPQVYRNAIQQNGESSEEDDDDDDADNDANEDEDDDAAQNQPAGAFLVFQEILDWLHPALQKVLDWLSWAGQKVWSDGLTWLKLFGLLLVGLFVVLKTLDLVWYYLLPFPNYALCNLTPIRDISTKTAAWTGDEDWCAGMIRNTSQTARVDSLHLALESFAWIELLTTTPEDEDIPFFQASTAEMADELSPVFDMILPAEVFSDVKKYATHLQESLTRVESFSKRLDSNFDLAVKNIRKDLQELFSEMGDIDTTWRSMTRKQRFQAYIATLFISNKDATTRLATAMRSFAVAASHENMRGISLTRHLSSNLQTFLGLCSQTQQHIDHEDGLISDNCRNMTDRSWNWSKFRKSPAYYSHRYIFNLMKYHNTPEPQIRKQWCNQGLVEDMRCCRSFTDLKINLNETYRKANHFKDYNDQLHHMSSTMQEQLAYALEPVWQDWKPFFVFEEWKGRLEDRWEELKTRGPEGVRRNVTDFPEKKKQGWRFWRTVRIGGKRHTF